MSGRIGYVILSHANPLQLLRLLRTLQRVYDNPPIACHHDFTQCPLRLDEFPSEVHFVSPHLPTRWGQFSIVAASLRALDLLYRHAAPDWFVLISSADYPTMRGEQVLEELIHNKSDVLLDYREVPKVLREQSVSEGHSLPHEAPDNMALAWRRYVAQNFWFPIVRLRNGLRIGRHTASLPFRAWHSPFADNFKCFYGDFWFTGNQKAAEILLRPTHEHLELSRYLRWRVVPDECYYQTVLVNTPQLEISKSTRRFAKWEGGPGAHPWNLELSDLPAIISAKAHFARKFAPGASVLDEIDRMLS